MVKLLNQKGLDIGAEFINSRPKPIDGLVNVKDGEEAGVRTELAASPVFWFACMILLA